MIAALIAAMMLVESGGILTPSAMAAVPWAFCRSMPAWWRMSTNITTPPISTRMPSITSGPSVSAGFILPCTRLVAPRRKFTPASGTAGRAGT